MLKLSKNQKLNTLLNAIYEDLQEMGHDEVKRYRKEFGYESDCNIAQYGNLLIYYGDIRDLYKNCGYKCIDSWSDEKIWNTYKRQVGYIARMYF